MFHFSRAGLLFVRTDVSGSNIFNTYNNRRKGKYETNSIWRAFDSVSRLPHQHLHTGEHENIKETYEDIFQNIKTTWILTFQDLKQKPGYWGKEYGAKMGLKENCDKTWRIASVCQISLEASEGLWGRGTSLGEDGGKKMMTFYCVVENVGGGVRSHPAVINF